MVIHTKLADLSAAIRLRHKETAVFFAPYTLGDEDEPWDLAVSPEDESLYRLPSPDLSRDDFFEHSMLILAASRFLLERDGAVIHGVAVSISGRGWLLTGPSGVGKTTQYELLKSLYPDAVEIVNGDKPILRRQEDGSFLVWPSPWPGKEGYNGDRPVPLAGIVMLAQSEENKISPLSSGEAAYPLFLQMLYSPKTEAEARAAAALEEQLLYAVPVFRFENRGDEASARLLYDTLVKEAPSLI